MSAAAPAEEANCLICYDKFSAKVRKAINCPKCQYASCAKCVQTYMLNCTEDPHCPNCRYGWTRGFVQQHLTKTFLNGDWAAHRRQILWQRERAYLPESQIKAEHILESRKLTVSLQPIIMQREELYKQIDNLDTIIRETMRNINILASGRPIPAPGTAGAAPAPIQEHRQFVRRCTHPNCQGFLSTAWKCGLCENYTCSDCLTVKGTERNAEHTCKEADLATARLIAKDTKPCPNCGEGIYRSEGCSHMFCTSCKTAFNWNTGKIQLNGYIDNPHYFAYMQATQGSVPRAPGDVPNGPGNALPSFNMIEAIIDYKAATPTTHGGIHPPEYKQAYNIRYLLGHAYGYWRETYNAHLRPVDTSELRIKFLLNEIDKETVERQLMNNERRRERDRAIYEIIDTFAAVAADLFRRYEAAALSLIRSDESLANFRAKRYSEYLSRGIWLADKAGSEIIHTIWTNTWKNMYPEFLTLRNYCNQALRDVSRDYGCVVPYISDNYTQTTYNYKAANRKPRAQPAAAGAGASANTVTVPAAEYPDTDVESITDDSD